MGKGKRSRQERAEMESKVPDSVEAIRAIDPGARFVDGAQAPTQPNGLPPPEMIEAFTQQAKGEGCVCDPEVVIHKSENGGGAIALMHKDFCPLLRVIKEEAS